ncbi:MAG: hypothetical protein Q8L10_01295 [Candidatus Moranbacteria bacterium]|nr:hypothetical protein [Candidatus Moranbacteria bacterium]
MTKNKSENKIIDIKPEFESILVCNDRRLKPYIEIIIQEPENITHQNLGTLIGVLEVTDTSEDSSYIVNYLVSIIKKEYFSKPKRGPVESLESALHKANLALSGLAEHGNISWLGKLNALIAVTAKNNLHLSQTGTAAAFLLRSKILTDVSEGLAPDEIEPHPLKTFVSVSSGRLEKNDKLIIATAGIFDIFSLEEIKKSSLRFSNEEFSRFLKTALSNELAKAAVLIANLEGQEEVIQEAVKKPEKSLNAFSGDTFAKKPATPNRLEKEKITGEIKKELQKTSREFTDKKTGHIYIKEESGMPLPENGGTAYLKIALENSTELAKNLGGILAGTFRNAKHLRFKRFAKSDLAQPEKQSTQPSSTRESIENALKRISATLSTFAKKISAETASLATKVFSQKNKAAVSALVRSAYRKVVSGLRLLAPSFEKIKMNVARMDYQQRLYAALILILILVVPLIGLKIQSIFNREEPAPVVTEAPPTVLPLAQDKNVVRINSLDQVYSGNGILKALILKDVPFAITETEVVDLANKKAFPIPDDFGTPEYIAEMQDLNLIFLMDSSYRTLSFSPISGNFQANNLVVPNGADIRAIGTYLTYIYLVDGKNNQIYRYPRAEGGFGERSDWLKDQTDLSGVAGLAISDNIFIAAKNSVLKLFRGKIQNFAPEGTDTPITIASLAVNGQDGHIFILDRQNSRVIRLDTDGGIVAQYHNPEIGSADGIVIDGKTGKIYIHRKDSIKALVLN